MILTGKISAAYFLDLKIKISIEIIWNDCSNKLEQHICCSVTCQDYNTTAEQSTLAA
jgi:hypothetical protein